MKCGVPIAMLIVLVMYTVDTKFSVLVQQHFALGVSRSTHMRVLMVVNHVRTTGNVDMEGIAVMLHTGFTIAKYFVSEVVLVLFLGLSTACCGARIATMASVHHSFVLVSPNQVLEMVYSFIARMMDVVAQLQCSHLGRSMCHMHIVFGFGIFTTMPDGMRKLLVHLISMASRTVMLHIAQLRIDVAVAPASVVPAGFLVFV